MLRAEFEDARIVMLNSHYSLLQEQYMRFARPFVFAVAIASTIQPALAQAPRLQFLNRLKDDTILSGAVTLKVSADPILRPKGIKVGIEVDGQLMETAETLPWTFVWDSTDAPDGRHLIRLVLVNMRTRETGSVDEMRIRTSNRVQPVAVPADPAPDRREGPAGRDDDFSRRIDDPREPERGRIEPARPNSRESREAGEFDAETSRAANALEFPASSLQVESGKLLIGRRDGSITAYDPASRDGWSVKPPLPVGEVLSAARASGFTVWLCADAAADSKKASATPARWLLIYRENNRKVRAYDLREAPAPAKRVTLWRGSVVLTGPSGGSVLDPEKGLFEDLDSVVGTDLASSLHGAETYLSVSGGRALLVAMGRAARGATARGPSLPAGEVAAWALEGDQWASLELPLLADAGIVNIRQLAAGHNKIAIGTQSSLVGITPGGGGADLHRADFPASDQTGRPISQITLSGTHLWCLRGSALFHLDSASGKQDAFLPWNVAGLVPRQIAADGEALWIGTNQGIKRMSLSGPDGETGYAGFVRIRLGADQDMVGDDSARRLSEEIDSWQGVPYLWGGETRKGVDCSGFVMRAFQSVGVYLDHGSSYLRTCRKGQIVRDELKYGDVLVVPGHCMIYTGEGTTAETVNKAVGRASIWRRSDVVVRRFLGVPDSIDSKAFATRSGYRKPAQRQRSRTLRR